MFIMYSMNHYDRPSCFPFCAHPELVEGFSRALKETLLSPASLLFAGVPVCRESEHGEKLVQDERGKNKDQVG
jgi:hypothetical protein